MEAPDLTKPLVTFTTFVLSLSSAALQNLGVPTEGPNSTPCVNLIRAQQTIEILEMLDKKTTGNLTVDEINLLGNILYDLRLRYVEAARDKTCK